MKKLLKLILKIIAVLILLGALGLLALRLMFPPEKVKQLVYNYAKTNLHREISFESVSFNLIGITLNNFAMSEEDSFEKGTFLKAERLDAKAAWRPLLKKRVEISTIYIDGLDVFIQKNKDGSWNVDSLSAPSEKTAASPKTDPGTSSAFTLTARLVKVTDCDFYYKDLQTGLSSSVEDLNIQLANVALDKPFPATVSFTSHTKDLSGLSVSVPVHIALTIFPAKLDLSNAYVQITNATAGYKNIQLALQGTIKNWAAPQINLTGSVSGLDNRAFTEFLPDLPNFTLPTVHLLLDASADLDHSTATVQNAAVRILDSALSTGGKINWAGENLAYTLQGKLQADIAQIVQMTDDTGFDPKGTLSGTFTATDQKNGEDVSGSITLKDVSALYEPFTLTRVNGTIKIAALDNISCASLTGLLNGEKFTSSFAYREDKNDQADVTFKLNLAKLTLQSWPEFGASQPASQNAATPAAQPSQVPAAQTYMNIAADVTVGEISVPHFRSEGVTLQAALKNVSENMQKTDGTVSFVLQPGAITDMDDFIKQSKVARIVLLPLNLLNKVGKKLNVPLFDAETQAKKGEITLTKAEGKYTFTQGVMHIDTTVFESTLTNLNAGGTANFVTNTLDMKASATLLTKQTPVVIKISGTMDNPSGKLDVLNTVTSVVGGILSYKTAKGAVTGTAGAATSVATGAAKTTAGVASTTAKGAATVATTTAKGTARVVKDTAKAIGSLFKKNVPPDTENTAADAKP